MSSLYRTTSSNWEFALPQRALPSVSTLEPHASARAAPFMRMLTLFTATPLLNDVESRADGCGSGAEPRGRDNNGGDGCGSAVSILAAPTEVAEELQRLFLQIAGKLFALDCDPRLPHLQMRDIHGFVVLPGEKASGRM